MSPTLEFTRAIMLSAQAENTKVSEPGGHPLQHSCFLPTFNQESPASRGGDAPIACEELFQSAILHHLAGELAQAERLYRRILIQQPRHAQASHNLGLVALNTGHTAAALSHFQTALLADPRQGQYWLSCVEALLLNGQSESARKVFSSAVKQGLKGPAAMAMAARLKPRRGYGNVSELSFER